MSPAPRRTLATYGPRGATVRVLEQGAKTVRVEWYQGVKGQKRRHVRDWPNTPAGRTEAKAWAKAFSEARTLPHLAERKTLRELWELYTTAEFWHLRRRTKELYQEHWSYWELMWGRDFLAEETTLDMVAAFRAAMHTRLAVSTLGKTIQTIKQVYRWGHTWRHLPHNPIGDYVYKVAKNDRPKPVPEYSDAEYDAIVAHLDPEDGRRWRAYVGLRICGEQGVRENAAVHLAWRDIDEAAGTVTWQGEWDKMGKTWTQPLREGTREALAVARRWRERLGYTGPWVIPPGSSKSRRDDGTYSPQSLIAALRTAETRGGVTYLEGRGPHGLRRLLAGNIAAATKDPMLAMRSIGDSDARQIGRYILERQEPIREAFEMVDALRRERASSAAEAPAEPTLDRHSTVSGAETATGAPEERPSEPLKPQGDSDDAE